MKFPTRIMTGDKVGAAWAGPYLTPYAEAIAEHYTIRTPWFSTLPITLGVPPKRLVLLTKPLQNDVLILGFQAQGNAAQLPFVYLQVEHTSTGIPWAAPNVLPGVPLSAISGLNSNAMPNLKLPEAFFMPAGTQLRLEWNTLGQPSIASYAALLLTLIGIQLTNPIDGSSPRTVRMPNGRDIPVGSRVPLFMTMGVGNRQSLATYFLSNSQQRIQYLPPIACDVEIHDLSTNMVSAAFGIGTGATGVSNLQVKTTVMGVERQWTPNFAPVTSLFGGPGGAAGAATQIFPAMPYTMPYVLPAGRRIKVAVNNSSITATFTQGLLTFRCVRLCEY